MSPVRVGWFVDAPNGEVVFDPPVPLRELLPMDNARAPAAICPAITHHIGRLFCVKAPFSLCVSVRIGPASCSLMLDQKKSTISAWRARELIRLSQRRDWRCADRPIVQMMLPYTFVTDDDVELRQLPPYLHHFQRGRPGVVLPGEFPLKNWPRPLSWAFEWHDASQPLHITRGEPLYYVAFEHAQQRGVKLVRIEKTADITAQQARIGGVTSLVRNTLRYAEAAGENRPSSLLPPVSDTPDSELRDGDVR